MKLVKRNKKLHNLDSPLLIGDVKDDDVVKKVREHCFIETHEKVLPLMHIFQSIVSLKLTKKFYHLCIFFNQLYTNILN